MGEGAGWDCGRGVEGAIGEAQRWKGRENKHAAGQQQSPAEVLYVKPWDTRAGTTALETGTGVRCGLWHAQAPHFRVQRTRGWIRLFARMCVVFRLPEKGH